MTWALLTLAAVSLDASDDLGDAVRAALARVGPSLVRIETVGGDETVGGVRVGARSTTGVILTADGLVATSLFGLASQPAGILAHLSDGRRLAATKLGADHSRMIVLLKVNASGLTPVLDAPLAEIRVGQSALAVGRSRRGEPSVSAGIVSAVGRVWGKAIQTDAKVSPVNYGGALVDLDGRALGVLAPLSPTDASPLAGLEWYDAGIGFAIPIDQVRKSAERLAKGDLFAGQAGFGFATRGPYDGPLILDQVAWRSPAATVGLAKGDKIERVAGQPIRHLADLKTALGTRYGGEKVPVVATRGGKSIEVELTLVDRLPRYQRPYLGAWLEPRPPRVRAVAAESPAAAAGLAVGDVVLDVDGTPIKDTRGLDDALDRSGPDAAIRLRVKRGDGETSVDLTLTRWPDRLPAAPAATPPKGPAVERIEDTDTLMPRDAARGEPLGLAILFAPSAPPLTDIAWAPWQDSADRHRFVVVVARPADGKAFAVNDLRALLARKAAVARTLFLLPRRMTVVASATDRTAAESFADKEKISGRVVLAPSLFAAKDANPADDHLYYLLFREGAGAAGQAVLTSLREKGHVAFAQPLDEPAEFVSPAVASEIGRWLDVIDLY